MPILAEHKNRDPEAVQGLIDRVATLLFLVLVLSAAIGMAAAPLIVYITAPGFAADPGKFALTVQLLRITFPYVVFISLVALSAGILAVSGLSGWLAFIYGRPTVFLIWLIVPVISVTGVLLIQAETQERRPIDWRILGGGAGTGPAPPRAPSAEYWWRC